MGSLEACQASWAFRHLLGRSVDEIRFVAWETGWSRHHGGESKRPRVPSGGPEFEVTGDVQKDTCFSKPPPLLGAEVRARDKDVEL